MDAEDRKLERDAATFQDAGTIVRAFAAAMRRLQPIRWRINVEPDYAARSHAVYGKGIAFETNGWTISVQSGRGNYCDTRDESDIQNAIRVNSEIAAWPTEDRGELCNTWIDFGHDQVAGYVPNEKILLAVVTIASMGHADRETVASILRAAVS
jgi:hypothetical protein